MNKKTGALIAGLSMALPLAAFGQSADTKYCSALSSQYATYAQNNGGKSHNAPPADVATAMSQCDSNAASGIPILEKALTNAKVALPARG